MCVCVHACMHACVCVRVHCTLGINFTPWCIFISGMSFDVGNMVPFSSQVFTDQLQLFGVSISINETTVYHTVHVRVLTLYNCVPQCTCTCIDTILLCTTMYMYMY